MAEEEVMRKRLAVEGDGGGDDRRVMSLLKTFVRWCNSKGLSDEESEATYQKMLFTLGIESKFGYMCMLVSQARPSHSAAFSFFFPGLSRVSIVWITNKILPSKT